MHNHPLNAERIQKGLLPVNSLYFWGGGVLPDQVKFHAQSVTSDDFVLKSLMLHADLQNREHNGGHALHDLRTLRDWALFEREYFLPAMTELKNKKYLSIVLDFSDGVCFEIKSSQKWRFWRNPMRDFA